ncbi:MAG: hypothetical protein IIZ98_01600 [Erysipelotrichaceae bacterium]|nr:hypothetical protein [Erysipelotrichaceae bacterium]MBQ1757011.1 hypothetical protein [Erysipelotrichaceae bacterium]MBQ2213684.1 hypothetical protein [Erysipelotrichaceae bacterium]MBR2792331.1 hypothetical protein [Erysipelotrichaceae bacterium]
MMLTSRISRRSRLEKNKRRIRRMKVDYNKYVKDFYLEDGLAIISCNVNGYYDIIDRYSVEGYEWLNDSFARFLESNAFYIPFEYPIVLEICGTKFNRKQREVITETIHDYYELKLGDKQMELNDNTRRIITFMVIAGLFTLLFTFVQGWQQDSFVVQFILIMLWFFIWGLSDMVVTDRSELKEDKMAIAQLASTVVRFREEFIDEPYDEFEQEKIYQELK